MATILSLKRRITATQNVSKTTKAMQMIAASKLKRAQNAAYLSRPYSEKLIQLLKNITGKVEEKYYHDYMKFPKNTEKSLLIIFAPDKGLCGTLIGNTIQQISDYNSKNPDAFYLIVGKKIEKYVSSLNQNVPGAFKFGTSLPSFDTVFPIIQIVNEYFLEKKVKTVKILYSKFINVFTQAQKIIDLVPVRVQEDNVFQKAIKNTIFEPSVRKILPPLLKHYIETVIYQTLLESYASEQAARMISMQNATNNAFEITNELKLEYNKVRQEKITNEILDIGSASFAYQYEQ